MSFGIVEERSGVEPFFPPAIYAEGFALLARGDYAAALTSLRSSSSRDPLVADEANRYGMRRAADAFRDGAIDTAVEQLQAAIELAPQRAEPHRILGLVWAAAEQYDRSADELKAAVKLSPGDERARLALADVLVRAGRADAAEETLRETIARLPASGRAHYTLARLQQRKGEQIEALKSFQACLAFNPLVGLNGIYQSMGAIAAARQNFDVAIDAYSKRVDAHPNDGAAHQDLGDTYARLSRSDEALAEFAMALTIDANRAPAYASLAQLYLRQAQYDDAVNAANRALTLDASQPETHYALGTALMRLGKADEGEKELKEFERLQQQAAADRARDLELGRIRREAQLSSSNGDHEKAASLLRRAPGSGAGRSHRAPQPGHGPDARREASRSHRAVHRRGDAQGALRCPPAHGRGLCGPGARRRQPPRDGAVTSSWRRTACSGRALRGDAERPPSACDRSCPGRGPRTVHARAIRAAAAGRAPASSTSRRAPASTSATSTAPAPPATFRKS